MFDLKFLPAEIYLKNFKLFLKHWIYPEFDTF